MFVTKWWQTKAFQTRGDCTKSSAAEKTKKMIEPESKPGTPQQKQGTEIIKNPFDRSSGLCSYFDFCVWNFMESGDIRLVLAIKFEEPIDFGELTVRTVLGLPIPNSGQL